MANFLNNYLNNYLVIQSGGPTCVINATLAGIIKRCYYETSITAVYGSLNGITGLINNDIIDLKNLSDDDIERIKYTPGAFLGSARYVLDKEYKDAYGIKKDYREIINNIYDKHIKAIIIIGGNDSMDTVAKLHNAFSGLKIPCDVIGVPKTIDNDLVITDHSPGYGSAAKYIASSIAEIKLDTLSYKKGRVTIVEIMGRDAGWLTAASKLASVNLLGPDFIYLPEHPFNISEFLKDVKEKYESQNRVLVCVSEGIKDENGRYISSLNSYVGMRDVFGHKQLGGVSTVLANIVFEELGIPVRHIELNLMQRCDIVHASNTDIEEAYEAGIFSVKRMKIGFTGMFVYNERVSNDPYKIKLCTTEVEKVANKVRNFPKEWIANGNDISEEFIDYCYPLIQGEPNVKYENGMPSFAMLHPDDIWWS